MAKMQIKEIKNIDEIRNSEALKIANELQENELLLIFGDGSCSKVSYDYHGLIFNSKTHEPMSRIPIDTHWRPIDVGVRLYNGEVRICRQEYYMNLDYVTAFYRKAS